MKKKWNSLVELDFHNRALAVFEIARIEQSLFPGMGEGDYYITNRNQVADIISAIIELCRTEHPLWNFGQFPDDKHGV